MKNAFTLIELLAVIVILAIIALIAVPIVIHIINDSKTSSEEQSVELYIDTVKKAIARKQLENSSFNPSICNIENSGNILCSNGEIIVDMKGIKPNKGIIEIKDNKVTYKNLLLNGKYYNKITELVIDNNNNGKPDIGDKYTYKVNDTNTFNFYVLSFNVDNTVNMIMDRNICNDGTDNYTEENNYCRCAWYINGGNKIGPVTAMNYLYEGTKGWSNVPDMIMNYTDENNQGNETNGYTGIITNENTKETFIISKDGVNSEPIGNVNSPLKARMPNQTEIENTTCREKVGTCPIWLIENLKYYNVSNDNYAINNNDEPYQNINGYWLLASDRRYWYSAHMIRFDGSRWYNYHVLYTAPYGIRPVITVPKEYLE